MESAPPLPMAPTATAATLSPWERVVAIFARPAQAWAGLETRAQWWLPLTIMIVTNVVFTIALHDRAIVPMMTSRWDAMVESGAMAPEAAERARESMAQPVMRGVMAVQQAIVWPLLMLVSALLVWGSIAFLLGAKMTFRQAFEVSNWSSLVLIPGQIVAGAIAWSRGTMEGIHLGLAALLPEMETPSRLMTAVTAFLDALGPFSIWSLVVAVLGATWLSGAPRPSVVRVMVGVYLVFALCAAALAAVFSGARGA